MTRRALAAAAVLLAACRTTPIPAAERYPAGTAFVPRYVRVLGTNIRYIDAGRGTPVIFLHGLGGSIYAWRKNLAVAESAGFRVIAFDNRGSGSSDKPPSGYGNADLARLLVTFMDSLGLPDAVLVGHSMGGAIAAEVALTNPRRVRGLVLIDPAGLGVRIPKVLRMLPSPLILPFTALRGRWITRLMLNSTYANPGKVQPGDVDQYYAPVAEPEFGRALRGVLREFRFDGLEGGRLQGLDVATLVLWGEEDRWIPPVIGMELAGQLLRSAYVPVPHAGHAAQEEAPDAINRSLIAFLRQGIPKAPSDLATGTSLDRLSSTRRLRQLANASQIQ
jgi:pimeloyl-ACP methyl ester carboxylesterase